MAQTPLMPKATAVWLVENTALTFDQIAESAVYTHLKLRELQMGTLLKGSGEWIL